MCLYSLKLIIHLNLYFRLFSIFFKSFQQCINRWLDLLIWSRHLYLLKHVRLMSCCSVISFEAVISSSLLQLTSIFLKRLSHLLLKVWLISIKIANSVPIRTSFSVSACSCKLCRVVRTLVIWLCIAINLRRIN